MAHRRTNQAGAGFQSPQRGRLPKPGIGRVCGSIREQIWHSAVQVEQRICACDGLYDPNRVSNEI